MRVWDRKYKLAFDSPLIELFQMLKKLHFDAIFKPSFDTYQTIRMLWKLGTVSERADYMHIV